MFVCGGLFFQIVLILVITFEETEQPQIDVEKHRDDYSSYDGHHEKIFRLIARKQGKYKGGCV